MSTSRLAARLLLAALCTLTLLRADEQKFDSDQPQSPPPPAPGGLTFIDQGTHDPRLKGYRTPSGFKLEIVAENPVVVNPVGLLFGDDGTPYVLEWRPSPGDERHVKLETVHYKDGSTRQVATLWKRVKDVVKTLTDSTGKGRWDKSSVILEDELPSSSLLHDGWLYLAGRGSVRRFRQSKPGGPYDVKEVIAHGFCGIHPHQVSGLTLGNDGWLYITSGSGDNYVEGSDGSRATALRTGAVFRCKPDGSKIHTYATGFHNPYRDVAFDLTQNMFHVDQGFEDGGRSTGCRLLHIAEGNDFGWRLFQGARSGRPGPVRGPVFRELPGSVPPLLSTGRGSPAGLLIYNDTRLPESCHGLLFYPDLLQQLIRAYRVEPEGASFRAVEQFELLKAPGDPLFRPCQMVPGPDGAIYIVDWRTGSSGAGRLWGDGVHGRIYRLSWIGANVEPALPLRRMDSWAGFAKMADDDLLEALGSEEASFRARARNELARRGEKNRAALIKVTLDSNKLIVTRIAALGALQSMWNPDVRTTFLRLLAGGQPHLRRLAADALGLASEPGDKEVHAALLRALTDDDNAVKRSVVMAMGRVAGPGAADNLAAALSFDDGKDVVLREGIVRALENLGRPGIDALLALADSGVRKDTERVVEAFRTLRTRPGYEALPVLLKNEHLSDAQRADLIRSTANYLLDPPVSVEPIFALFPDTAMVSREVKRACLDLLATTGLAQGMASERWLARLLDDASKDPPLQVEAVQLLGTTPAGARETARLFLNGKLPPSLLPLIAENLRQHTAHDSEARRLLAEILKWAPVPEKKN
jgi:putative membrane-bound dehydrogenase-like protein